MLYFGIDLSLFLIPDLPLLGLPDINPGSVTYCHSHVWSAVPRARESVHIQSKETQRTTKGDSHSDVILDNHCGYACSEQCTAEFAYSKL